MNGNHVVVTGGRGALGASVVEVLRARGAHVHVANLPEVDTTNEAQLASWYARLPAPWASIQLVGAFTMAPLVDTSLAEFERMWRLNTVTCFLACREAARAMRTAGAGVRLVNVAARPVLDPVGGMAAYVAAKAGVAALTRALAAELAADRILVNAVVPSIIDSPANRAAMPKADHAKWPQPAEIAETIAFLASEANALTSGALVPVYGRA
jgi:NAD(P)-dependent dehydrogenase (short-subunit alcohol dehydrogenase family)